MNTQKLQYPSREELLEIFQYADGHLYWKKVVGKKVKIGAKAGHLANDSGYIFIRINSKLYRAHRLIWIYHYGDIDSELFIDHINRVRDDNRIENLRIVSLAINNMNSNRKNIRVKNLLNGKISYNAYYNIDGRQYSKTFYSENDAVSWIKEKKSEIFKKNGLTF